MRFPESFVRIRWGLMAMFATTLLGCGSLSDQSLEPDTSTLPVAANLEAIKASPCYPGGPASEPPSPEFIKVYEELSGIQSQLLFLTEQHGIFFTEIVKAEGLGGHSVYVESNVASFETARDEQIRWLREQWSQGIDFSKISDRYSIVSVPGQSSLAPEKLIVVFAEWHRNTLSNNGFNDTYVCTSDDVSIMALLSVLSEKAKESNTSFRVLLETKLDADEQGTALTPDTFNQIGGGLFLLYPALNEPIYSSWDTLDFVPGQDYHQWNLALRTQRMADEAWRASTSSTSQRTVTAVVAGFAHVFPRSYAALDGSTGDKLETLQGMDTNGNDTADALEELTQKPGTQVVIIMPKK